MLSKHVYCGRVARIIVWQRGLQKTDCDIEKCYAVGAYDRDSTYFPLILESGDGRFSWQAQTNVKNLPGDFKNGVLYDV